MKLLFAPIDKDSWVKKRFDNETNKPITMNNLTMPLYESPQRERNEEKHGTTTGNQCICCMKPMKDGETKMVHMNEHWLAVAPWVNDEKCLELTGANSQGWFNIGNNCARHMKGFVITPPSI